MTTLLARIGLTVGDPAGIGPEIVLKALSSPDLPRASYTVYGSVARLLAESLQLRLDDPRSGGVSLVDIPVHGLVTPGLVSSAAGRAAADAVLRACDDALAGLLDAVVTAPLNKESLQAAGHPWPGHTEMLAARASAPDVAMMFVGGGLRVALVTIHCALASVPTAVTAAELCRVVRLVDRSLPRFVDGARRIAVCGLNPHAGEGGMFGREEIEVLAPAVAALRAEGIDVAGPLPADTVFVRAVRGEFDAVIANYHDQGLIPVKLAAFGNAVNVTIGLPFVRTSVDHGTAFDIVGQGVADAGSLLQAIRVAVELAGRSPAPL